MKKLFLAMSLMCFCTFSYCQVGIKIGLNFANMMSKDDDEHYDEDYRSLAGLHIGPTFDIPVGKSILFQSGLLYSRKGLYIIDDDDKYTFSLHCIDIPLGLGYTKNITEKISVFGGTGIYAGLALGGKHKWDYDGDKEEDAIEIGNTNSDDIQRFDLGWQATLGVQYQKVRFNLGYQLGIKNLDSGEHNNGDKFKNRCFQMSISYLFGNKS